MVQNIIHAYQMKNWSTNVIKVTVCFLVSSFNKSFITYPFMITIILKCTAVLRSR